MKKIWLCGIIFMLFFSFSASFLLSSANSSHEFVATITSYDFSISEGDMVTYDGVHYLGAYSFTYDTVGANPSGFLITEPADTDVQVISEMAGHSKVVRVETTGGTSPDFLKTFSSQSMGATYWEAWVIGSSGLSRIITQRDSWVEKKTWISFNWDTGELRTITLNGASSELISSISADTWYHIRVQENANDKAKVWLNGEYKGEFNVYDTQSTFNQIRIGIYLNSGLGYFDAIDYSWASGYYINRNMATQTMIPGFELIWVILVFGLSIFLYKNHKWRGFQVKN